jgi:hypothetical protein
MGKKGRPVTKPAKLREGFYLEMKNKGSSSTVKVRRENMPDIEQLIKQYDKIKDMTYLGELKGGVWLDGKNKGKKANK